MRMTARRLRCGRVKLTNIEHGNANGQRAQLTTIKHSSIDDSSIYNSSIDDSHMYNISCTSQLNLHTSFQNNSDLNHTLLCTLLFTTQTQALVCLFVNSFKS